MRAAILLAALIVQAPASLTSLEQAVAADPENLRVAAEYRQLAIAASDFDRPIDFLEKLAKRKGSGPNIQISLALAYVDKVPTSGDFRRLYLGRDAMGALTKAIERRPTVLAYYMRGLINLYYNKFIFKRIPNGIEDLKVALSMITHETPAILGARVYLSLGDGYWKLAERVKARDAWTRGAEAYPADAALKTRLVPTEAAVTESVTVALYAGNRVDTTLRGVVP
jgi:tetratricopeptide (TPR) repeat protein